MRARRSRLHLVRMIAQEMRLKASKVTRTNLATGPVVESRSRISPPTKNAGCKDNGIVEEYLVAIIDDRCGVSWRAYPEGELWRGGFSAASWCDGFMGRCLASLEGQPRRLSLRQHLPPREHLSHRSFPSSNLVDIRRGPR